MAQRNDFAPGLSDPRRFGSPKQPPLNTPLASAELKKAARLVKRAYIAPLLAGALGAGGLALTPKLRNQLSNMAKGYAGESGTLSDDASGQLRNAMGGQEIPDVAAPSLISEGAGYLPGGTFDSFPSGVIVKPTDKPLASSFLAHELGHGTGFTGLSNRGELIHKLKSMGLPIAGGAGFVAGTTKGKDALGAAGYGALAGGLGGLAFNLPSLIEEGRASLRGLGGLKEIGYDPVKRKQALKSLVAAYGTYLTPLLQSAALGSLGALAGRLVSPPKEKKRK